MKKDYLLRLQQIAQAQLVDEIGRRGVRFFAEVDWLGLDEELNHILASAVASEINGAGQYPTLKKYIDDCVREDVETMVVEDARNFLGEPEWKSIEN